MKNTRKSTERRREERRFQHAQEQAAWEKGLQEGYRKVGLSPDCGDRLDPLFNKYPHRWPDFFRFLHRTALTELSRCYSKDKIEVEVARYKQHFAADLAKAAGRAYTGPAYGTSSLAQDRWFHVLVQILEYLEIWDEKGLEAGLTAVLGDPVAALWLVSGKDSSEGGRRGGDNKRQKYEPNIEARARHAESEIRRYRRDHPKATFSQAVVEVGDKLGCSEGTVRADLKKKGINNAADYNKMPT